MNESTPRAGTDAGARGAGEQRTTLVLAAMSEEIQPLTARCRIVREREVGGLRVYEGTLGNDRVLLARTGEGRELARRGAAALLEEFPVSRLIGIGVAGGLSLGLKPGAIVVARQVNNGAEPVAPPDVAWAARVPHGAEVLRGTVVSTERILCTVAAKQEVRAGLDPGEPAVVDLESASFARAASARGVPYLVLRAVCDTAEEELPFDLNECRDATGAVDRLKVFRRTLSHPSAAGYLWELKKRLADGSERLARLVEELLEGEKV